MRTKGAPSRLKTIYANRVVFAAFFLLALTSISLYFLTQDTAPGSTAMAQQAAEIKEMRELVMSSQPAAPGYKPSQTRMFISDILTPRQPSTDSDVFSTILKFALFFALPFAIAAFHRTGPLHPSILDIESRTPQRVRDKAELMLAIFKHKSAVFFSLLFELAHALIRSLTTAVFSLPGIAIFVIGAHIIKTDFSSFIFCIQEQFGFANELAAQVLWLGVLMFALTLVNKSLSLNANFLHSACLRIGGASCTLN